VTAVLWQGKDQGGFVSRLSLLLSAALFVPGLALAQESHKFNAKALASTYEVPIFAPKGAMVVGNEVVESANEEEHTHSAVYYVKSDVKKVLEFYGAALGEAKKTQDGVDDVYTFKKNDKKVGRKVRVRFDNGTRAVEVTLVRKEWQSEEDVEQ
jgi:hypothetical protein